MNDDHPLTHPLQGLAGKVDQLEVAFLQQAQAPCPVMHRFGPGIYIREVTIPAGTLAIGHAQRFDHLNVFIAGRVSIVNDDGSYTELRAPMTFVGKPGRKVGYIHETVIWQNVYATDETDIEKLEAMYLDKSPAWQVHRDAGAKLLADEAQRDFDRADYFAALDEFGFTEDVARAQSENRDDQIPFPYGGFKVQVAPSRIEGKGLFATAVIEPGEIIAPARIGGLRTPAGRYTNHAREPNAVMEWLGENIVLVATRPIRGMAGGQLGDEITIDYRAALRLQIKNLRGE